MKNIKVKNLFVGVLLTMTLLVSLFVLSIKKREFDVAYDFYRRHYFPRLKDYSEKELDEHFASLTDSQISVSVENLKLLESTYEKKLKHRKGGVLMIEVKKPYDTKQIDFDYVH